MPQSSAAGQSGLAAFIPFLAVLIAIAAVLVIAMQAPSVRRVVGRVLAGQRPEPIADLTEAGPDAGPDGPAPSGAMPFPAFDPSIYGPVDPDDGPRDGPP